MPLEIPGVTSPLDLHRRGLADGFVHGLARWLSIERIISDEQTPTDIRRRNSACALMEFRNRRHHLNDDNPSSG
jgi:hypothetical protein